MGYHHPSKCPNKPYRGAPQPFIPRPQYAQQESRHPYQGHNHYESARPSSYFNNGYQQQQQYSPPQQYQQYQQPKQIFPTLPTMNFNRIHKRGGPPQQLQQPTNHIKHLSKFQKEGGRVNTSTTTTDQTLEQDDTYNDQDHYYFDQGAEFVNASFNTSDNEIQAEQFDETNDGSAQSLNHY